MMKDWRPVPKLRQFSGELVSFLHLGGAGSGGEAMDRPDRPRISNQSRDSSSLAVASGPVNLRRGSALQAGFNTAIKAISACNYLTELREVKVSIQADGKMEMSALMHACFLGDLEAAQKALEDIDRRGHGHKLLEAELDRRDAWAGSTPLHWAAYSGNVLLIQEMLRRGADATAKNLRDKSLPIHLAARFGQTEAVHVFVMRDAAQLEATNSVGSTPLHEAAFEGHAEVVALLVDLRANLEVCNDEERGGLTPLLAAVQCAPLSQTRVVASRAATLSWYGHLESVRVLLDAGVNISAMPLAPSKIARDTQTLSQTVDAKLHFLDLNEAPAVGLALATNQLEVALELLFWRIRHAQPAHGPEQILSKAQLFTIVLDRWANTTHSREFMSKTPKLFAALLLSTRSTHGGAGDANWGAELGLIGVVLTEGLNAAASSRGEVRNPVLLALELAAACDRKAQRIVKNGPASERLREAAYILEHVASGFLESASRAARQAAETKQFNPWKMGGHIQPAVARQIFIIDSVYVAAFNAQKGFLAHPLVNRYLSELFMPSWGGYQDDTVDVGVTDIWWWPKFIWLVLLNIVAMPFMPLVPRGWVKKIEAHYRQQAITNEVPMGLVWTLPWVRFALGLLSGTVYAHLLTSLPPMEPISMKWDGTLALYLFGMFTEEVDRIAMGMYSLGRQAGFIKYMRDPFNVLDLVSVLGLAVLLFSRQLEKSNESWVLTLWAEEVPCQAALALVAWLRVLQGLFVFPKPGVLLLMAIRMLSDLASFLALGSWIIFAFSCSFYVLSRHNHSLDPEGEEDVSYMSILKFVLEATLNGEPDRMVHSDINFASNVLGELLMILFAVVVVLLLLNLLIANFNYTFDAMHQNVHANYRVAFARVVVDTWGVLAVYAVLEIAMYVALQCWGCVFGTSQRAFQMLQKEKSGFTGGLGRRRGSLHEYSIDSQEWHVNTFLSKATEKGVALLPECVEEYAQAHKHDIAPEERWRSSMLRDVSVVQEYLTKVAEEVRIIREMQQTRHFPLEGAATGDPSAHSSSAATMARVSKRRQSIGEREERLWEQGFSDSYLPHSSPPPSTRARPSIPEAGVDTKEKKLSKSSATPTRLESWSVNAPADVPPPLAPDGQTWTALGAERASTFAAGSAAEAEAAEATTKAEARSTPPRSPKSAQGAAEPAEGARVTLSSRKERNASGQASRRLERGRERAERKGIQSPPR